MKKSPRPSAEQRAKQRRVLLRQVRANPRVATHRWFLRKASLFGVDLPITIRLSAPDTIRLKLGTGSTTAPLPDGVAAGDVDVTVTGSIGASLRFSQDSAGYGQLGAVELGFGQMDLTGTGFDLVEDSTPGGCTDTTLLKTDGPVGIGEAPGSRGYLNLLGGNSSISLHTAFTFASQVRADCADAYTLTSVMTGASRPTLPIRLDGRFRVSPSLTADGRVRLGRLVIDGPQSDSFAEIHSCTTAPPPATCPSGSDGVLPGRLLATAFQAEILIGAGT